MVNYGHNQTVGFRERRSQNLVKVGKIRLNLIDGPETIGHGKIHIQILINRIEEYSDILVLEKFGTNWILRLSKQNYTST